MRHYVIDEGVSVCLHMNMIWMMMIQSVDADLASSPLFIDITYETQRERV